MKDRFSTPDAFLHGLTQPQATAARTITGPLLVLAGPGSGKTRTVTHRIAHMLHSGVPPRGVLAITFTNKAAREMQSRVESLVGDAPVWVSTFHKFCARLLRINANVAGLESNYSILDVGDQRRLMKETLGDLDIDTTHYQPDRVLAHISNAKNDLVTPERFAQSFHESIADHFQAVVAKAYPKYQAALKRANSVDFDDLLTHVAVMLLENEGLADQLAERYQYILVDEYQDTNTAQYQIVATIAARHRNLCVTGDPDQSIYGWRGAKIENILNFERDFPETSVVRLEHNFRSTPSILAAADQLIRHNRRRKAKTLVTDNEDGRAVQLWKFDDGTAEADCLAETIHTAVADGDATYNDYAILYRVNTLSRELERALSRLTIPYHVAQGTAFYDRAEVKDVLAYLRLLANPDDRTAFQRIVNKPARRLGQTSQNKLAAWAEQQGLSLFEAARRALECDTLGKPARGGFKMFADTISSITLSDSGSVAKLVRAVVERTGYLLPYESSQDEKAEEIVANVQEVITAAAEYDRRHPDNATLEGFLEESALVSDTDTLDESQGQVTLMTLHAAKGLEFPRVIVIGVEQGLLPHERSLRENTIDDVEEERRLLFVGMTRAEQELTLTHTAARALRGRTQLTISSQFVPELDVEHVDLTTSLAGSDEYYAERDGRRFRRRDAGTESEWGEPAVDIHADRSSDDDSQATAFEDASEPITQETPTTDSPSPPAAGLGLTTAADLLAGTSRKVDLGASYDVGMSVKHPHYGVGVVTALGGVGRRRTVTVDFGSVEERFVIGFSPLEPVT